MPEKTINAEYSYPLDLLSDAMSFIIKRHNYGRKRRKEIRDDLMKKWSQLEKLKSQGAQFNV